MKLKDLKASVDRAMMRSGNEDLEVCIPTGKPSMGPTSTTGVRCANPGIDWDAGKFIIWPEKQQVADVAGQTKQLKAYANWLQEAAWDYPDKDFDELVDVFLSL